jgi:neutral trehalase
MNSVWSNPVNNEVLTVIGSGAISEGGFGSPGRLREVDINHIDYVSCNDLYDGVKTQEEIETMIAEYKETEKLYLARNNKRMAAITKI